MNALSCNQGRPIGDHHRDRFGGCKAISWFWSTHRFASARIAARNDLAMARQARRFEYGRSHRGYLLVCPSFSPDVPSHAGLVAERLELLGRTCGGVRAHHPPLRIDDVDWTALRSSSVASHLNLLRQRLWLGKAEGQ